MKIGIPKEIHSEERRVAATPETIEELRKLGFSVVVEAGAGTVANFADDAYREEGAEIVTEKPSFLSCSTVSGVAATRRSSEWISLGMPIFIAYSPLC